MFLMCLRLQFLVLKNCHQLSCHAKERGRGQLDLRCRHFQFLTPPISDWQLQLDQDQPEQKLLTYFASTRASLYGYKRIKWASQKFSDFPEMPQLTVSGTMACSHISNACSPSTFSSDIQVFDRHPSSPGSLGLPIVYVPAPHPLSPSLRS